MTENTQKNRPGESPTAADGQRTWSSKVVGPPSPSSAANPRANLVASRNLAAMLRVSTLRANHVGIRHTARAVVARGVAGRAQQSSRMCEIARTAFVGAAPAGSRRASSAVPCLPRTSSSQRGMGSSAAHLDRWIAPWLGSDVVAVPRYAVGYSRPGARYLSTGPSSSAPSAAASSDAPKKTELKKKADGGVSGSGKSAPVTTLLGESEAQGLPVLGRPAQSALVANAGKWIVTKSVWLGQKVFIDAPIMLGIKTMEFFKLLITGRPQDVHCAVLVLFCFFVCLPCLATGGFVLHAARWMYPLSDTIVLLAPIVSGIGLWWVCLRRSVPACIERADPMAVKASAIEIWGHVKEELYHYKLGSKLLWRDMKTSTQLLKRVFSGYTLSRRERQQLLRTSADMFRLVGRPGATCCPRQLLPSLPVFLSLSTFRCPFVATGSICRVRYRTLHGVPAALLPEAVPKHAAEHVSGTAVVPHARSVHVV